MTRFRYSQQQKLEYLKEYLEGNLTINQFCKTKPFSFGSFKSWLDGYNKQKETWSLVKALDSNDVKEEQVDFKKDNQKETVDYGYRDFNNVKLRYKKIELIFDKSILKEVLDVLRKYD